MSGTKNRIFASFAVLSHRKLLLFFFLVREKGGFVRTLRTPLGYVPASKSRFERESENSAKKSFKNSPHLHMQAPVHPARGTHSTNGLYSTVQLISQPHDTSAHYPCQTHESGKPLSAKVHRHTEIMSSHVS